MTVRVHPFVSLLLLLPVLCVPAAAKDAPPSPVFELIDEYKSPGLESEISGILPHPEDGDLYYALANRKPPYRYGHEPKLGAEHRGNLLTVNRKGEIVRSIHLADDDFGGLAAANGKLYVATTNGGEILEIEPENGRILRRFALPSPAGGLAYDADRNVLLAQLYVGHPHLAIVDVRSGEIVENLWSDESAMGLAKVDGDWLCTWASGWDPGSFSELRILDQKTGRILSRYPFELVHSVLAPARSDDGRPAFISLVTVDSHSGETVIRKYRYRSPQRVAERVESR